MYRIDCSVYACDLLRARHSLQEKYFKTAHLFAHETNIIREDRVNVGVTTSARTQNLNKCFRERALFAIEEGQDVYYEK